jgi:cell wall assembly regulator SMI1
MSDIANYWKTIDDFLRKTNANIYNSLSGPADENNIKELENILKVNLPDTFKESLLIHNGQNEKDNIITFVDYHKLLSVNEMIKNYKMLCGLFDENETIDFIKPNDYKYIKRNYIYNHKWLKFTESNGDGLIIDFDPGEKGTMGQIFFRPHDDNPIDKIIAKSYGNWLRKLCGKIGNKEYEIKNGALLFEDIIFID